MSMFPGVAQLVARMVRVHEAVGSNPATRTNRSILRGTPIFFANSALHARQPLSDLLKKLSAVVEM